MRHYVVVDVRPVQIIEFETAERINHFARWFKTLPLPIQGRVRARLERIKMGALGDIEPVGEGVSELRFIQTGPGFRIYFGMRHRQLMTLLCGGDKGSQKHDIKLAKLLWAEAKTIGVKK